MRVPRQAAAHRHRLERQETIHRLAHLLNERERL
jgi:hypothetical protein